MRGLIINSIILGAVAGKLFLGCAEATGESAVPVEKSPLIVRALPVKRMDLADTMSIYGEVDFRQEAFLASQFEGRLSDFSLLIGDRVKAGQQIGVIIPPSREALLQLSRDMPPEINILAAEQVKAILLYSPLNGVVLEVFRHSGDVLQKDEHIVHIGDDRLLQVRGDLPVKFITAARKTQQVTVDFPNTGLSPRHLKVAAISAQIDPLKQTVLMRLDLPNPGGDYRPGMLAKISLPAVGHFQTLAVSREALVEEEGLFSVFVINNQIAEKRLVKPGIMSNDWVEIISGVAENERVIIDKAYSLQDGMVVAEE